MTPPRAGRREWAALAVLALPVLIIAIDGTVLGFAVPSLSEDLGPTGPQLLWIVDVYSFVLAGLLVTMGTLGDRIGRRRLLLIGAAGFGVASVLAALAHTPEVLIAARALLGLAGATLMPSTLSLLRNIFTDRDQRRLAIAIWGSMFAGGSALGPIVGGWLLEHYWWGSVFLMNLPVMLVLLVLGPLLLPESRDPSPGRYDVVGAVMSLVAMLSLVYGIKKVAESGLAVVPLLAAVVGLAAGVLFVRRQRRLADPLLDLNLFRYRPFSVAVTVNLMGTFALVGSLFFISQYLQLVLGLSPLTAGLRLLPGLLLAMLTGLLAVRLVRLVSLPRLLGGGLVVSASGLAAMVTLDGTSGGVLVLGFALVGGGIGLAQTLSNDVILSAVPPERAGGASAVSETGYELGAALGTAILGSVLTAVYRRDLAADGPDVPASSLAAAQDTLGGAVTEAAAVGGRTGDLLLEVAQASFVTGMHTAALVAAGAMFAGAVLALVLLRTDGRRPPAADPARQKQV